MINANKKNKNIFHIFFYVTIFSANLCYGARSSSDDLPDFPEIPGTVSLDGANGDENPSEPLSLRTQTNDGFGQSDEESELSPNGKPRSFGPPTELPRGKRIHLKFSEEPRRSALNKTEQDTMEDTLRKEAKSILELGPDSILKLAVSTKEELLSKKIELLDDLKLLGSKEKFFTHPLT